MSEGRTTFEGHSYRTSSRFGSRVLVSVESARVSVTGPRVGVLPYRLWIALMVVLLWLIPPSLLAAAILGDWRYLVVALALAIAHWGVAGVGAACLWEVANLTALDAGKKGETTSFPLDAVKRVKIGRAWARKGLWLVIPQFIPLVNMGSGGRVVSFEAPDGATGADAAYAFELPSERDVAALAALLAGREPSA